MYNLSVIPPYYHSKLKYVKYAEVVMRSLKDSVEYVNYPFYNIWFESVWNNICDLLAINTGGPCNSANGTKSSLADLGNGSP